jgi:hypothetical protein
VRNAPAARALSRRRTATWATAALCLLIQLVATAHLVVARHEVCAEHGEVIHAGDHHADPIEATGRAPTTGAALREAAPADDHREVDDHCRALTERRDITDAPALALPLLAVAARPPAPPVAAAARATSVYRLAPKNSPPPA